MHFVSVILQHDMAGATQSEVLDVAVFAFREQ
jgi:hypothetical protein